MVGYGVAVTIRSRDFDTDVKTNYGARRFKRYGFEIYVKNSKIFACRSAFNRQIIDVTHLHRLFDFYKANLWKLEFTVYNANTIALIERPVALMMVMLTFETWILTQVLEEILVRSVQITQSLLQSYAIRVFEESILFLLLHSRKHSASYSIVCLLASFVLLYAIGKPVIVNETNTTESAVY